jgi:hypothetical protein
MTGPGLACASCAAPAGPNDPPECCDYRNVKHFPGAPTDGPLDFYRRFPSLDFRVGGLRRVPVGVRPKDAAAWRHMAGECWTERCRYCKPHRPRRN